MDTLCKKLLWLTFVLVLGQSVATAQDKVSKQISKSYAISHAGELELENRYGDIHVYGWDKEEVSVAIDITVHYRKRDNAKELLDRIRPVIQHNGDFLSIMYEVAEKNSGFFAKLFEDAIPFDFNRSNIKVDYTIYMPVKAELKVTNAFGDVLIDDWKGKLNANIEHGDLFLSNNLNKADVTMKYGKLRANNINYGNIDIKNGGLNLTDSKNLRINSSGTDIELKTVGSLEIYSNKDDLKIEEVGTIYGSLKFTTAQLDRLGENADLSLKIADFRVAKISNPKADIVLEQESSEISLNISNFSHQFEATLEEGLVRMPKSFENIKSKMLDKGKKLREIKAHYGDGTQGNISITGSKGLVLLKEL
ncbi:hypothetical protein JQC67_12730 [Aurantibacter crassamenti]|uniref:hypothetical protein n=1 Tax=Aurantibacter crassamenti TaxID=1837375 RepID=UPI00193AD6C0|nr:hypothetical protein [Aurantibacter crassamenti]MBM1107009.1 hypothetical protein [Aurantibacter crassamenti]